MSIRGVVPGRCDRWSHIPKLMLLSAVRSLAIRIYAVLIASKCRAGRLTVPAIPAETNLQPILNACGNSDHESLRIVHRAGLPPLMNLPGTTSLSTFGHCRQVDSDRRVLAKQFRFALDALDLTIVGRFDWWSRLLHLQARRHAPHAGTPGQFTSIGGASCLGRALYEGPTYLALGTRTRGST